MELHLKLSSLTKVSISASECILLSPFRDMDDLIYQIALKKLDTVGAARAKKLVSYCGGVREVFEAPKKKLATIPGIGEMVIKSMNPSEAMKKAEAEIKFIEKSGIKPIFYLDKDYPRRLKHCDDGPLLLYSKGACDLNPPKVVSIVGTRNVSSYGKQLVEKLVSGLKDHHALIVSGLAYGVDVHAHKEALKNGLSTVGVLGNSLDTIYPSQNKSTAEKMLESGMLLSEFESGTKPEAMNFPQRNRIVAGMCDVCVVVESAVKGGSMITAKLAVGYNRDVMAYPGPVDAIYSGGCNYLIKTQQAHLIEGVEDLEYVMGWDRSEKAKPANQKQLFVELNEEEQRLFDLLKGIDRESLDNISLKAELPVSQTSTILLEMEFKGVVKSMPGKMYQVT